MAFRPNEGPRQRSHSSAQTASRYTSCEIASLSASWRPGPSLGYEPLQGWPCVLLLHCCPSSAPPASGFPVRAQVICPSCQVSPPSCQVSPPSHRSLPRLARWVSLLSCIFAAAACNSGDRAQGSKVLLKRGRSPGCRLAVLGPAAAPLPARKTLLF